MRSRQTAAISFASDSRGRAPFALVAVLLLVGSSAFATSLSLRDEARVVDPVDTALDRTTVATRPALRDAVATAARDAARRPVVRRANSTYGQVLNESTTFRDALRIRIYLAARERLPATRYRHRGVTAVASLPPTPNASALRAAKRRVRIDAVDGGRSLRVTIPVTMTARRVGFEGPTATVATGPPLVRERERFRVTVATPVLLLHARTERFETRLNRGPLKPGLGQHLTARLYPVAWARGATQYAGGPIENVVPNRHVALAANGGILAAQRAAFGQTDPEALGAYSRATARTWFLDVLAVTPQPDEAAATAVLPPPDQPLVGSSGSRAAGRRTSDSGSSRAWSPHGPQPEGVPSESLTVGINGSADEAFLHLVAGDPTTPSAARSTSLTRPASEDTSADVRRLDGILRGQYRAAFRLVTDVERVRTEATPEPRPAGGNWTLDTAWSAKSTEVGPAEGAREPGSVPIRGRTLDTYARSVVVHETTTRVWLNGTSIRRTNTTRTSVYRVDVALVGWHAPRGPTIPDRRTRPLFRPGGELGDRNLGPAVHVGRGRLIEAQNGRDGVARAAVLGTLDRRRTTVTVAPPTGLRSWVLADVARLRERIRNVSTRVDRASLASGNANPSAALAATLRERRTSLVDAPRTYDGIGDRARIAARAAYVDAVIEVLSGRAARRRSNNDGLATVLARAGGGTPSVVRNISRARKQGHAPPRRSWGRPDDPNTPGDAIALVPDGEPAYLTLAAVDRRHVSTLPENESYYPLAARNLNLFTVPYGDAVDVVARSGGGRTGSTVCEPGSNAASVRLRAAGRVLIAANETLGVQANETLRERRDRLATRTQAALDGVRRRAVVSLTRRKHGGVPKLRTDDARAAASAGFARWDGTGQRAVAAANGSLATAIAEEAAEREAMNRTERDLLATSLRVELRDVVTRSHVDHGTVDETTTGVRSVAHEMLKREAKRVAGNLTEQAAENALGPKFRGIPAGLPLLPAPGYWVATVNVWHVEVRGEYARFSVHARTGAPGTPGGVAYVRERATVALDVDGDGDRDRLGANERIDFETGTVVVMAVPPSGRGVGDVDGNADERSAGWNERDANSNRRSCRTP